MSAGAVVHVPASRLQQCVRELAAAIDRGDVQPEPAEIEALAEVCVRAQLPDEATRVLGWLGWSPSNLPRVQ